jgi:hypothetical protein
MFFSNEASNEYDKWIYMPSKTDKPDVKYGEAHMKYSPDETIAHFRKIVNKVPWDILRYARLQLQQF